MSDKKEGGLTICGGPPQPRSDGAYVLITITLLFGPVETLSKDQLRVIRSMRGSGVRLVMKKGIVKLVMQRVQVEHYDRIRAAFDRRAIPFSLID